MQAYSCRGRGERVLSTWWYSVYMPGSAASICCALAPSWVYSCSLSQRNLPPSSLVAKRSSRPPLPFFLCLDWGGSSPALSSRHEHAAALPAQARAWACEALSAVHATYTCMGHCNAHAAFSAASSSACRHTKHRSSVTAASGSDSSPHAPWSTGSAGCSKVGCSCCTSGAMGSEPASTGPCRRECLACISCLALLSTGLPTACC